MAPRNPQKDSDRFVRKANEPNVSSDLSDYQYRSLLPSIEIVENVRPLSPDEREGLVSRIKVAILGYYGSQFTKVQARQSTLHEISAPLDKVIDTLEHKANIDPILIALGAPPMLMVSRDRESVDRAILELQTVLRSLRKIRDNVQPPPPRRRGKPKALDLYRLVDSVAECWELWTRMEFTQLWLKLEPLTEATKFTHSVVATIDPTRLRELPTITRNVVADRRKRRKAASLGRPDSWGSLPRTERKPGSFQK